MGFELLTSDGTEGIFILQYVSNQLCRAVLPTFVFKCQLEDQTFLWSEQVNKKLPTFEDWAILGKNPDFLFLRGKKIRLGSYGSASLLTAASSMEPGSLV